MGFGILFFGYLMLFNVPYKGIDFPPDILAYILIFIALNKLSLYGKKIKIASYICIPLLAQSALKIALQLAGLFVEIPGKDVFFNAIAISDMTLTLPFHFFMLIGFAELASEVELPKLSGKCKRNFAIVCFCYLVTLFFYLYNYDIIPFIRGVQKNQVLALQQLFGYVMRFMNILLISSCYRLICLEGDEDMPYTPNKFEKFMTNLIKGDKK